MHMIDNVKNFLYDKDYFISIFDNSIHVFNYVDLLKLSDTEINLQLENFILEIKGNNLRVGKMIGREIQVIGEVNNVGLKR